VGVVIGEDLVVRDGELVTQPVRRSKHDRSIRGYKTWRRREREAADAAARTIVLNTYRTLMTRGLKGCYVYAVDEGVRRGCGERDLATRGDSVAAVAEKCHGLPDGPGPRRARLDAGGA
jgi:DUF2075 family protein